MREIIKTPCPTCKKRFARYVCKRTQVYCSIRCAAKRAAPLGGKARTRGQKSTRDQTGSKNPNWRGGISKEHYRYKKAFAAKNPEKVRAHLLVRRAIARGQLLRGACTDCATTVRVHAHHHDYSKPLSVMWLCQPCHNKRHALERRTS